MKRLVRNAFAALACTLMGTSLAHAQATRTWVSGVGDDANPCSRTAPCKTLAGAISKTAEGGEISVLDPGGYGGVTITKSIIINGAEAITGVLVSGTNAINVSAGASDVVILRNLHIHGLGTSLTGIRYNSGTSLVVENCHLTGFDTGINVIAGSGALVVTDSSITGGADTGVGAGGTEGLVVNSGAGRMDVSLNNVSIRGTTNAIDAVAGLISVSNSVITQNSGFGVIIGGSSTVSIEGSMLTSNGTGVLALPGATIRLSNSGIYNNLTGFGCGGGTVASASNNRTGGNGPGCAPNALISVQ
jgi:hypothetical protein